MMIPMEVVSSSQHLRLPSSYIKRSPFSLYWSPFKSSSCHPRSTFGPPPSTGHFRSTTTGCDVMRMRIGANPRKIITQTCIYTTNRIVQRIINFIFCLARKKKTEEAYSNDAPGPRYQFQWTLCCLCRFVRILFVFWGFVLSSLLCGLCPRITFF